jgi:hypothetical protein
MSEQWFEVVERWTDARGAREMIIFCGPLKACETFAAETYAPTAIRPISF